MKAPGLAARLVACVFAICVLWMTSLSVAVEVTSGVLAAPTLAEVVLACRHAYAMVQEQKEEHSACVERQSTYCQADFDYFAAEETVVTDTTLADAALVVEAAQATTDACDTSRQSAELALKAWQALGTGHVIYYSSGGNCTASEALYVQSILGDTSGTREEILSASEAFALKTDGAVEGLASFARRRMAYDESYVQNQTQEVLLGVQDRVDNITAPYLRSLNASMGALAAGADRVVSCVSTRDEAEGMCQGLDSARDLVDGAFNATARQLALVSQGLEEYEAAFDEYRDNVDDAFSNVVTFVDGATSLVDYVTGTLHLDISELGLGSTDWLDMSYGDFFASLVTAPDAGALIAAADAIGSAVAGADEIWDGVGGTYAAFVHNLTLAAARAGALAGEWETAAQARLANLSYSFELDPYDPPQYDNASSHGASTAAVSAEEARHRNASAAHLEQATALLDALGASGANLSRALAPSFNATGLRAASAAYTFDSEAEYSFASFTPSGVDFGAWMVSLATVWFLLFLADYLFRAISSVRLLVKFWGRGALNVPDADIRVDRGSAAPPLSAAGLRSAVFTLVTHRLTMVAFFAVVGSLVLRTLSLLYVPFYNEYRAGCVEHTADGTFLTQNLYSVAYNYAADGGNRRRWEFQEEHTSRRSSLCGELTAGVQQALTEDQLTLQYLRDAHRENVARAELLLKCLDTELLDSLFREACCGEVGYGACEATANASSSSSSSGLECPVEVAASPVRAFDPVGESLSNASCHSSTLLASDWKIQDAGVLDCNSIPTCRMSCEGPNEELLRAVTKHAGCMVEWIFHAGWLKMMATFVMFGFMNLSRMVCVAGLVKWNWHKMHTGIFTYQGTCTREGELVVGRPEEIAERGRKAARARGSTRTRTRAKAVAAKGEAEEGETAGAGTGWKAWWRRGKTGGTPNYDAAEKAKPHEPAAGVGGAAAAAAAGVAGRPSGSVFKDIVAGAVEMVIDKYETTACLTVGFGLLLNLPWVLLLSCLYIWGVEYNPEL